MHGTALTAITINPGTGQGNFCLIFLSSIYQFHEQFYLYGKARVSVLAGQLASRPSPERRFADTLRREGNVVPDVLSPRRQHVRELVVICDSLVGNFNNLSRHLPHLDEEGGRWIRFEFGSLFAPEGRVAIVAFA